jgi:hypothetical protein
MATIEEAQHIFRSVRFEIVEFDEDNFAVERGSDKYLLAKTDIDAYLQISQEIQSQEETQIWYPGYYEHAVQFEGTRRRPLSRDDRTFCLDSRDGVKVEISRPSSLFLLSKLDTDNLDRDIRRLMMFPIGRGIENKTLSDLFRLYTIRVSSELTSSTGKSQKAAHDVAEACVFHFVYGNGTPISFTKTWARTYYWIGRREVEDVQFPLKVYNTELVSYYNLALSSDSMILGFLALYKILEFFYSSVSEEELHSKMKEKLTAPDFSHTKTKKLRELSKVIRSFENRTDELSALKLVLQSFFDKEDLRVWVNNFEENNGEYFTTDVEIFSKKFRVDTSDNTIIPNIANRIYATRNVIVHNKEAEVSRYVPFTGQEETLQREVQLLVYLAEQLILKTGRDIKT